MPLIEPTPERLQKFLEGIGDETPIVMINLLRYREQANYPEGFDATPCSGREAYGRYGQVAMKKVEGVGGRLLWAGKVELGLIATDDDQWDDVAIVQYPSRKAFVDMISQPDYMAATVHRTAGLADTRLIATTTVLDLFEARVGD